MQVLERPTLIFAQYTIGIPEAKKSPKAPLLAMMNRYCPPLTSWVQTTSSARGAAIMMTMGMNAIDDKYVASKNVISLLH